VKTFKTKEIIKSFSLTGKIILAVFFAIFVVSGMRILGFLNDAISTEIPHPGGKITEGLVGTPRLINPLLAVSETDRTLTQLVYSGLMKVTSDGLVPDLAETYEVSEDGLEYKFIIKEGAVFHDGESVTADDVIFTVISAQNPDLKSPRRSNWEGISIEKINDKEIIFRLKQPYSPFLQNMTIGILPRHIWEEININEFTLSNFNTNPIGTGPFKVRKIETDSIGIPKEYELVAFDDYTLGRSYLDRIIFKFYKNQSDLLSAYQSKEVQSIHSINPQDARILQLEGKRVESQPLPRIFGLFINQTEAPVLSSIEVRRALDLATPKSDVLSEVLYGFGTIADSPVPKNILNNKIISASDVEAARDILRDAGWIENENGILIYDNDGDQRILSLSISTSNVPELVAAANIVAESWRLVGAEVEVKTFDILDLNQSIIRPRKFEVLLFGMVIGRDLDLYAFWHSSQRDDPGLNITSYANIETDRILENIRTASQESVTENIEKFVEEIQADIPAIFLYSPDFIYLLPENLKGVDIQNIISSEERFMNVHEWFINTDKVWNIFIKN
jgi:peptide/nickel transport system substrate-binding protein